jgi:hypothetical protein
VVQHRREDGDRVRVVRVAVVGDDKAAFAQRIEERPIVEVVIPAQHIFPPVLVEQDNINVRAFGEIGLCNSLNAGFGGRAAPLPGDIQRLPACIEHRNQDQQHGDAIGDRSRDASVSGQQRDGERGEAG